MTTARLSVVLAALVGLSAHASGAPNEPVRIEVPSAPGRLQGFDWGKAAEIPCDSLDGRSVPARVVSGSGRLYVQVSVAEPPGFAMGVHWFVRTDDGSPSKTSTFSYRPQEVRGPMYVGPDRHRFEGSWRPVDPAGWEITTSISLEALPRENPIHLALAVTGRLPNRLSAGPPGSEFGTRESFATLVPPAGGWPSGDDDILPGMVASLIERDEVRLRHWREHVEARSAGGSRETARERLVAPLDRAIEARPDLVMLYVVRGDVLRDLGDLDGARASYDEALEVGPHFPEARWARERFRAMEWVSRPPTLASDYAGAYARIAEESKALAPGSPAPALAEGFLRHREGKFDRALELLEPFAKTHAFDDEIVETVRLAQKARELWAQELGHREADAKKGDLPRVRCLTAEGPVVLELFEDEVPNTVANFVWIASSRDGKPGFYDGTTFDTTTPFSLVRGGDPYSREGKAGHGDAGWAIKSERGRRRPFRGMVAMDDAGPDTAGSRFFLLTGTTVFEEDRNAVFGRVVEGQDVVDRLLPGDALERVEIVRLRDHEYRPITLAGEPAPEPRPTARR